MNWSDERYVKLYVRKTATWLTWPWEARAVFPSMLKEADGAGLIDVGSRDPVRTLAIMLAMPSEVVQPAIDAMLETGTLERTDRGFLITAYIEAQEATKTESRRKQDQRERQRAQVRATTETAVTRGHEVSRGVPLQPSPAQLTTSSPPAQPSPPPAQNGRERKPKAQAELIPVPPPPPKPPSRIGKLHEFFTEQREARWVLDPPHGLGLGDNVPPDEPPDWGRSAAALQQWLKRWPDMEPAEQDMHLKHVIVSWLDDSYWVSPKDADGNATTPFPWGAFITPKQFAKAYAVAFPEEAAA